MTNGTREQFPANYQQSLTVTQNGGSAVGPHVAHSLDYRLIDDSSECNFLDKAAVGGRRIGD